MTGQPNSSDSQHHPPHNRLIRPTLANQTPETPIHVLSTRPCQATLTPTPAHLLRSLTLPHKPNRSIPTPSRRPPNFCQRLSRMITPARDGQTARPSLVSQFLQFLDSVLVSMRHSESINKVPHCHRTLCLQLYAINVSRVESTMIVARTNAVPEEPESCDLPRENHGEAVSLHLAAINVLSWWVPLLNR